MISKNIILTAILPLLFVCNFACNNVVSSSSSIFFSKELGKDIEQYNSFSTTWWNFIVTKLDWDQADHLCKQLKDSLKDDASVVQCGSDVSPYAPIIRTWAQDLPNRQIRPEIKNILWESNRSLLKLSLVSNKNIISMIKDDPLGTYRDYIKIKLSNKIIELKEINGFIIDENNNFLVIPVMMAYQPTDVERTEKVYDNIKKYNGLSIIGTHASNYENYRRIVLDVQVVTYVALILLFILSFILLYYKRYYIYLLIPAVCLSALISAGITILVFGSIHGLTISFGIGILGISFDYGFQSIFCNTNKKKIWLRNFMGLITTIIVLVIIGISEIPLLRQMMFFSTLGLVISYTVFAYLDKYFPKLYNVRPFNIKPFGIKAGGTITVILIGLAIFSFFYIKPDFGVGQFDYQDKDSRNVRNALFKNIKAAPLFLIQPADDILDRSHSILDWSNKNNIRVETMAKYVPSFKKQGKNITTWTKDYCRNVEKALVSSNLTIFNGYFNGLCNRKIKIISEKNDVPVYLSHLEYDKNWLTIFFPSDKEQSQTIKQKFLKAISVLDLVSEFPKILSKELWWKMTLSFLLIIVTLFLYYRSWKYAVLATVPFLSGIGLFIICTIIFNLNFTFISLVGILMIYGFSIDYGIFSTDADNEQVHIWSALVCAEITTISGFLPLIFAHHPVLMQLGQSLFIGAIGTFVGAFWGVPFIKQFIKRKNEI